MKIKLNIWKQENAKAKGRFEKLELDGVEEEMSFLEMLDSLNEKLIKEGQQTIAFEHDCREGICGSCGLYINGRPHGPGDEIGTCQLHMRAFKEGDSITIEPWRAKGFPVIKDLIVDRNAFDKIMSAGGFVSVDTGQAADGNAILISKIAADKAFDAAACIGCGACVAACKNSSATLFVAAKVSQLALLPQGKVEAKRRALNMIAKMDELGFGSCTNTGACEAECPKGISIDYIAMLNREYLCASFSEAE